MEKIEGSHGPKKPEMDAVDREAHEMFMESSVDKLQEALHIDNALTIIVEKIEEGVLNPLMTVEEMIDALETKKEELIGGDAAEDGDDK